MAESLRVPEGVPSTPRPGADALVEAYLWRHAGASTRRAYRRAIADYRTGADDPNEAILSPTPAGLLAHRAALLQRNGSPSAVNVRFAALRGLFDFLVERGALSFNPARRPDLRSLRVDRPTKRTPADAAALLSACDDGTDAGLRDRAIILLAVETGLQRMQIAAVRSDSIRRAADGAWLMLAEPVRLSPAVLGALEAWAARHAGPPDGPLFVSLSNNRAGRAALSGTAINLIFKRRARRAGLGNVTPRAARGGGPP